MAEITNLNGCCGMDEIHDLAGPSKNIIVDVCKERDSNNEAKIPFYLFTDALENNNGSNLAKYIIKNKLGKIICTTARKNPNSSNYIRAWIWEVNNKTLAVWAKKEEIDLNSPVRKWDY